MYAAVPDRLYTLFYPHLAIIKDAPWCDTWYGWLAAVVLYDFCDYWLHRASLESAIFWAAHGVHHQNQCFNLSTALRQESAYAVLGWTFFVPLAVLGMPPELYAAAGLVVLVYQFWIHTEHVDKNDGAIFAVWDRLFGTFEAESDEPESEPCVCGTRTQLNSWNPLWAVGAVYADLLRQVWLTQRWPDKMRLLFKAPGWQPADLARLEPKLPFRLDGAARFDPPLRRAQAVAAGLWFIGVLAGCCAFSWWADDLGALASTAALAGIAGGLWAIGALFLYPTVAPSGDASAPDGE